MSPLTPRERQELDRHITGNYGEDQLRDEDFEDGPEPTDEQLEEIRAADLAIMGVSAVPTRYAVICDRGCGTVFLLKEEYDRQIGNADDQWHCPQCGAVAAFDDDNYEGH